MLLIIQMTLLFIFFFFLINAQYCKQYRILVTNKNAGIQVYSLPDFFELLCGIADAR